MFDIRSQGNVQSNRVVLGVREHSSAGSSCAARLGTVQRQHRKTAVTPEHEHGGSVQNELI